MLLLLAPPLIWPDMRMIQHICPRQLNGPAPPSDLQPNTATTTSLDIWCSPFGIRPGATLSVHTRLCQFYHNCRLDEPMLRLYIPPCTASRTRRRFLSLIEP